MRTAIVVGVMYAVCCMSVQAQDISVKSLPPVVVKTEPMSGDTKVDPKTKKIKVTFSKDMMDKSWSWSQMSNESFPEIVGSPRYLMDKRTCEITVKLKPKTTYAIWVNTQKFTNFKDKSRNPAIPYLLVFETR